MKKLLISFSFLLGFIGVQAQVTTVTGTVSDNTGQVWYNSTVTASFVPASQNQYSTYFLNGVLLTPAQRNPAPVTVNSSGVFTIALSDNLQISPAGSTWNFAICPTASVQCSIVSALITGTNINISSTITTQLSPITVQITPVPSAYSDGQIKTIPAVATLYYNTGNINPGFRAYNGSTWGPIGGGTGGGSPGAPTYAIQYYLNSTTFGGFGSYTPSTNSVSLPGNILVASGFEDTQDGIFSNLSPLHDGGVANPTDGSTGNATQQTINAAECYSLAHNNMKVKVIISALYPITTSVGLSAYMNEQIECSSISNGTYAAGGGCLVVNTNAGNNTATGGTSVLRQVFNDSLTCSGNTVTPQAYGSSWNGFVLAGGGYNAGGNDIGVIQASSNVSLRNISSSGFFGGPFISTQGAAVNIDDENIYFTNVDGWWANNPTQIIPAHGIPVGGVDWSASDSKLLFSQMSTGQGFSKNFHVGAEYPNLCVISTSGAGNHFEDNLIQTDEIGFCINSQQNFVTSNRIEYMARQGILNAGGQNVYVNNKIISPCLDSNLGGIPGSATAAYNCSGVSDSFASGSSYIGNQVQVNSGVNGISRIQSSYNISYPANPPELQSNTPANDTPDAYGNGIGFFGGTDNYANGGPAGLANNNKSVNCNGGGTCYVGDAKRVIFTDTTPVIYTNFQGMAANQTFYITATSAADIIQPSGYTYVGHSNSVRISTCDSWPITMIPLSNIANQITPGQSLEFIYDLVNGTVQQADCSGFAPTYSTINGFNQPAIGVSQGALTVYGIENIISLPNLATPTVTSTISPGSSSDSYIIGAWVAGAFLTSPVITINTANANLATYPNGIYPILPNGALADYLYRVSGTQSGGLAAGLIASCVINTGCSINLGDNGNTPSSLIVPPANSNPSGIFNSPYLTASTGISAPTATLTSINGTTSTVVTDNSTTVNTNNVVASNSLQVGLNPNNSISPCGSACFQFGNGINGDYSALIYAAGIDMTSYINQFIPGGIVAGGILGYDNTDNLEVLQGGLGKGIGFVYNNSNFANSTSFGAILDSSGAFGIGTSRTYATLDTFFALATGVVRAQYLVQTAGTTAVPSAATVPLTQGITHISGVAAISTFTVANTGSTTGAVLWVIADGAWTTTTSGNIHAAMTAVVGTPYQLVMDGANFYIK